MNQNLISQTMTDAQRDAMLDDLIAFDTKFAAYKVALAPDEIAKLAKISEADVPLLEMALNFAQQNPTTLPGTVNVTELTKDIGVSKQLTPIKARAKQELDFVITSQIAALSDAYKTALLIYNLVKVQGRTPQNQTFLDAFGARFAKGPQTPPTPPTPPNP